MNEEKSAYQIGNFENNKLVGERYLSNEEYQKFVESIFFLRKCNHTIDLYNFVIRNYNELIEHEEEESKTIREVKYSVAMGKTKFFYLEINRMFLNYLTIVKSFIDYLETDFKRTYGTNSPQADAFKRITSICFDNSFSYRFFYKLRNYAQHIDLPISNIRLKSERVAKDKVIHYPIIVFNKKSLLEKFNEWGVMVKKDLEKFEDEFEVFYLLEEHIERMKYIYIEVTKIRESEILKSTSFLTNLTNEYREKYNNLCVFKSTPIYENNKLKSETVELQKIELGLLDYLRKEILRIY